MTELGFEVISALVESDQEFPVDFEDAWQWIGYNQKGDAKHGLIVNFEEGIDFQV